MRHRIARKPRLIAFGAVVFAIVTSAIVTATGAPAASKKAADNGYSVHNLVSDQPGVADHLDPHLVNAWGITASSGSPWWVADNGMDVSTLYNGAGVAQPPLNP